MIGPLILLMLGGLLMGGAIAFFRQQKPLGTVALLFVVALGCVALGATLARSTV